MSTHVGVGLSRDRNTIVAARAATQAALDQAGVEQADCVLVFMTVGHDARELLPVVRELAKGAPLLGCSVEGCISRGVADESAYCVEVTVIASDELRLHVVSEADLATDPRAAGLALGRALQPHLDDDATALLVFGDAFSLNFAALEAGLGEGLGTVLPVFGGGASNDIQSTQTFQFHDDEVYEHGVVCALLSSPSALLSTVTHGCQPLGVSQTVTRSKDNWIYEIDGKPALDVLSGFITREESENWLMAVNNLCLALELPEELAADYDPLSIRYLVGRDEDTGAVMIQTEIAEGTSVQLVRREVDRICDAAEGAAAKLGEQLGERKPKLMMQLECVGRGRLLMRESDKLGLLERVQRIAPDAPWLGAYISGEIAPVGELNMFHNYTGVVLAVL